MRTYKRFCVYQINKEYTDYGCPYVQEDCDVQVPSDNVVIYGHHMVSYIQSE